MNRAGSSRLGGLPAGASTRAVLERLAQVLISNGALPSQLSQQFARACRRAIPPPRPSRRAGLTSLDHSHVLSHWYRDPRFLDASGAPKALPLAGPGVSLKALVRRVFPRAQPEAVLGEPFPLRGGGPGGAPDPPPPPGRPPFPAGARGTPRGAAGPSNPP